MNMIQKLRRKFILVATIAVALIVSGALGVINGIRTYQTYTDIQSVLTYISDNQGTVPATNPFSTSSWLSFDTAWIDNTPEFSYQTRYFSILFTASNHVKMVNINHIAAFNEQQALAHAQSLLHSPDKTGYFKINKASYAYQITPLDNGEKLIVILDCTRDMADLDNLMRYSLFFGFLCILFFVLILAALSGLVIRPFIENMENQKRFITNAGHELKTPLAIISANTEALELFNGKSQWTGNILAQVKRLTQLVEDLIILAKQEEQDPKQLPKTTLDLAELTRTVAASFEEIAKDKNKPLQLQIPSTLPIHSNEKCLHELLNILLDNAVKYGDDGGTITIHVRALKKGAYLCVSNPYAEGSHTDFTRFFERFYRADTSHNSAKSGYGIGLSMAQELVQLLKGKIQTRYTKGQLHFIITLPKQ